MQERKLPDGERRTTYTTLIEGCDHVEFESEDWTPMQARRIVYMRDMLRNVEINHFNLLAQRRHHEAARQSDTFINSVALMLAEARAKTNPAKSDIDSEVMSDTSANTRLQRLEGMVRKSQGIIRHLEEPNNDFAYL